MNDRVRGRAVQVMPIAGGWLEVISIIENEYIPLLRQSRYTHVVGLIDCDDDPQRIRQNLSLFPDDVRERIFLLGTLTDPETIKANLKMHFEQIGAVLAEECLSKEFVFWKDKQLSHLDDEFQRAIRSMHSIIFSK